MRQYIAMFVRDSQTGRVEHREVFGSESTEIPADVLTKHLSDRIEELHRSYNIDRYDVFWHGYFSTEGMLRSHPELEGCAIKSWNPSPRVE